MNIYCLFLQGDSISQWWQWQGPHTPNHSSGTKQIHGQFHGSTATLKANVVRTSSLKDQRQNLSFVNNQSEDEDDDDVFVTADPIRGQHVTVKSAIISTTNPYCTSARVSKRRFHNSSNLSKSANNSNNRSTTTTRWEVSSTAIEASAPSPSSESSSDSSLVLSSSSASSTTSHSPLANTSASILSHDQVHSF